MTTRHDADPVEPHPGRRHQDQEGLTLIEVVLSAAVVLVAALIASSAAVRAELARKEARDRSNAFAAIEQAESTLQSLGPTAAYQGYGPTGMRPPLVAAGLSDSANPAQAAQVAVTFFTDETAVASEFGMPRDLDGDGLVTNVDTGTTGASGQLTATILPYSLTLSFRGANGGIQTTQTFGVLTAAQ